jgi:pimeloyl-ACP methyl ester carboxylesterase
MLRLLRDAPTTALPVRDRDGLASVKASGERRRVVDYLSVTIDGQRISYLESPGGQADRTVVFAHGNSSSARSWLPLLEGSFGQRFRCLALDLPGHGRSGPASDKSRYSAPGHAAALAGFAAALGAADPVVVGWSLGGHAALEAAQLLPEAPGFVIFGAPPVATAEDFGAGFLPNPSFNFGLTPGLSESEAKTYAESFVAPGSALAGEFVPDILATDGAARAGLAASVADGRFADEVAIAAGLRRPLAIFHGAHDQLVSLDYLRKLTIPALWRGDVQVIGGAGHAPHLEEPTRFADLLTDFIRDLAPQA